MPAVQAMRSMRLSIAGFIFGRSYPFSGPTVTIMMVMKLAGIGLIAICVLAVGVATQPPLGAGAQPPRVARLVAIGDLHADVDGARRAFRLAGAIDERDAWIGGNLVVVQTGDFIGRGSEDRAMLDFLLDLQARAKAAGGTLHLLIGNHEVFAARLDHRWVHPDAFAAFNDIPGLDLRQKALAGLPPGERARGAALMPGGRYARQLAAFPTVLRVGDTIFAHGGVLPMWAKHGIDRINTEVREWLMGRTAEPASAQGLDDGSADDGVMWSRHFAVDEFVQACAVLKESLSILRAKRMVVAHTRQPTITSRCQDQVWAIDVGISRYYGGDLQVLEIVDDRQVRIVSPHGGTEK